MKKTFGFLFLLSILVTVFISSCDKIDPPYKESEPDNGDTVKFRKFLLEEFTGHTCPNCPQGAAIALQLKSFYGERLINLSIHASELADPGIGEFAINLHSPTGDDIFNFFQPLGFPCGMLSRTGWTSTQNLAILDKDAWGARIESLKTLAPIVSIELTNAYDTTTRVVSTAIECDALTNFTGTYKIAAYLTEDSIITAQSTNDVTNYPDGIIHQYVNRHVLRGALNSTWGDTLTTGNTVKGTEFIKNYNMTLSLAWNYKHCFVVAFVYDTSNYEIVQVEEKRVK